MPAARGRQRRSRDKRSPSVKSEREALLTLLREGSISTSHEPDSEGFVGAWSLNSPGVTLTTRGAELAGRCLLRLLEPFEGRQLVASSLSEVPLLQACVMLSRGKYHGLLVQPGTDSTFEVIEGRVDPAEPVVLIQEFLFDGGVQETLIACLSRAGLWVEGGVSLVRAGYLQSASRLRALGVPMFALYNLDEVNPELRAGQEKADSDQALPLESYAPGKVPEGLRPAELARLAATTVVGTRKLLRPPRRVTGQFAAAGGLRVRVQPKDGAGPSEYGFWYYPGEKAPSLPVALTRAASMAGLHFAQSHAEPLAALEQSTVTVRFFSALEPCEVGQLDPERYGIVVRSRVRPDAAGEALPGMPGITNAWQQFEHARTQSARLLPDEPFLLYRYQVQEATEGSAPV
ncbi:MAG TPA: hypothetical protein VF815_14860, partial [Myxococcaceae bacterium]